MESYAAYPELNAEAQAIARRQKIAEAMMARSQQPLATNQMAGGYVVPVSAFQGLGQLANAWVASKNAERADTDMRGLADKRNAIKNAEMARISGIAEGTPATPDVLGGGGPESDAMGGDGPYTFGKPAVPGNMNAAIEQALFSQSPEAQRYGSVLNARQTQEQAAKLARETRAEADAAKYEQRNYELGQNHQNKLDQIEAEFRKKLITEEQAAKYRADEKAKHGELLKALKGMGGGSGGSGKAPVGYRWTSDGQGQEVIPGGPADAKAAALAQRQADGATDVDVSLSTLRDAYDRLEKGGGITSTKNDPLSNLTAAASSSGIGQGIGKMLGTQNQSARNDILMARPALLAALMKATGMNARQMDSNAELKFWLSTATDPTLDVESNRKALENIEKKYLRGPALVKPADAPTPPTAKPTTPSVKPRVVDW